MMKWFKKLFKLRPTFGKHTPIINRRKFPRLKTLDARVAAARGVEFDKDAM